MAKTGSVHTFARKALKELAALAATPIEETQTEDQRTVLVRSITRVYAMISETGDHHAEDIYVDTVGAPFQLTGAQVVETAKKLLVDLVPLFL